MLSAVANLARFEGIDPEKALQASNDKFTARFSAVEKELHGQGRTMKEASLKEMVKLWNQQKPGMGGPGS